MPARTLLSSEQRTRLFSIPTDPVAMARHYALNAADLAIVRPPPPGPLGRAPPPQPPLPPPPPPPAGVGLPPSVLLPTFASPPTPAVCWIPPSPPHRRCLPSSRSRSVSIRRCSGNTPAG